MRRGKQREKELNVAMIIRTLAYICVLLFMHAIPAIGSDVYIAMNTTGADTGANCANARSVSWFNGNATGGNTYHLCGMFTGSPGSTMLTPPSGSAGNTLTVKFEDGAILTAPYWGGSSAGAINIINKSYITIDGGTNGVIKNTANGTLLANQQASKGIYVSGSNHITVKNLAILDIFKKVGTTTAGVDSTNCIRFQGSNSDITIDKNTFSAAHDTIIFSFSGSNLSNIDISNNLMTDSCHHLTMGGGGTNVTSNILIHGNEITDWTNWALPTDCHTDGIILYQDHGNAVRFNPKIYNNYIHGDLGMGSPTGFIFCTYGSGSGTGGASCDIYNNLLVKTSTAASVIWFQNATKDHVVFNNTIIGPTNASGTAIILENPTNVTIKNNIFSTFRAAIGGYGSATSEIAASDSNLFYNIGYGFYDNDGANFYTLAQWQALGFDRSSITSNPLFNSNYTLQSGSPAIDKGATLGALYATDKAGTSRPQGSAWDIGAYEYGTGAVPPPPVPLSPHIISISP